jgi:4-hydroxybenzoate polyprenyltransferase
VAFALASCIVLYDAGAKRTLVGPLVMGGCRTLNVLLGMSLAIAADGLLLRSWTTSELMLALGVGIYIAGVTVFARSEAGLSGRKSLSGGIAILLLGIALITAAPVVGNSHESLQLGVPQWFLLWALLAFVILRRCVIAWRDPLPLPVQNAVRTCLRSIIVIDAAIVLGYCGPFWGSTVLALLVPMLLLERWASTT